MAKLNCYCTGCVKSSKFKPAIALHTQCAIFTHCTTDNKWPTGSGGQHRGESAY